MRIYELARILNMDNRELLEKLGEMNISVKSHMSSIDEETSERIIAFVKETKDKTSIEETRVTTKVIRRRKKEIKAYEEEPVQLKEEEKTEEHEEEDKGEEKKLSEEEEKYVEESIKEPDDKPDEDEMKYFEKEIEVFEEEAIKKEEEIIQEEKMAGHEKVEIEQVLVETAETVENEEENKPDEEQKKKSKKRRKRKKKDTPAKIIKLPDEAVPFVKELKEKAERVEKIEKEDEELYIKEEIPVEIVVKEHVSKDKKVIDEENKKPSKVKQIAKKKKSERGNWKKQIIEGDDIYSGDITTRYYREKKKRQQKGKTTQITIPKAIKRKIKVDENIIISDLAKRIGIKSGEFIKKLIATGVMATINQSIDFETASLLASEFNFEVEKAAFEEQAILKVEKDAIDKMKARPPIITIMGHVDHGKTSLLDMIRKTKVTDTETGGITQHIGAYNVKTETGGQITFLDTPGHEAFTAMRSRGASITDIVVLVVAADDGVMPQTVEAINHSKVAKVPIIVAINKMDKPDANPENVTRQLAEYGLIPEKWGGETIFVEVSAKKGIGINDLLEMILLQAEMLELKANEDKHAIGYVIEAKLDSSKGPVASVIIQSGSLNVGDFVVCGVHYGKIRAMIDDTGKPIKKAGPSMPLEILGISGVPAAGDELLAVENEKVAKQVSVHRSDKMRSKMLSVSRMSLESLFEKMQKGEVKDLNLIIKADVQGSIEALKEALSNLSTDDVKINIIHSATGTVTESDIGLASVSNSIILGFTVRPSAAVVSMAEKENVDMRFYTIIYDAINDIKDAIKGMINPTFVEKVAGRAEIRQVFHVPKVGSIAGCYVIDGKIERGKKVRIIREGIIQYEGAISSLKRFQEDVKEVQTGYECGIGIENYNDIKDNDIIECYYMEEVKRS